MPQVFLNFAYGSNMASRRLRERTPSARPVGVARLDAHRLAWHKAGRDGSAKCDIVPTSFADDLVWGVLYEIAESDRVHLDAAEGLGRGYEHLEVRVHTAGGPVIAGAYRATAVDPTLRPFDWYAALVVAGALEHGLPDDYVARLRAVPTCLDPDAQRRAHHHALVRAG